VKEMKRQLLTSALVGTGVTVFGFVAAYLTQGTCAAWIFYWQGFLLAYFVPAPNIGTPANPVYEATPVHVFAFFLGIPVGLVLYSLLAFVALSIAKRNGNRDSGAR
jgi:ABC-type Mn2+/Zn2+ transport system permease subunit